MLAAVASAMEGNAPRITTKTTARSENPSHSAASGSHAIGGSAWSPTTSAPTLRWKAREAAIPTPISVPNTAATAMPNTSRSRLREAATGIVPSVIRSHSVDHTVAGVGRSRAETAPVAVSSHHTTTTAASPARAPATLAQIPRLAGLSRDNLAHLLRQPVVDVHHDPGQQRVLQVPRPGRADAVLLEEHARRRRHQQDPVGQQRRLPDIVGDEHERRPGLGPHALDLDLQRFPRLGVERAERLVGQQDVG